MSVDWSDKPCAVCAKPSQYILHDLEPKATVNDYRFYCAAHYPEPLSMMTTGKMKPYCDEPSKWDKLGRRLPRPVSPELLAEIEAMK